MRLSDQTYVYFASHIVHKQKVSLVVERLFIKRTVIIALRISQYSIMYDSK
jgi:hypothetical protein